MTNWKTYEIISRNPSSGWIRFNLDSYVSYSGGIERYIYCKDYSPFNGWYNGDCIEIDNDKTRYESSTHDFTSTTQVRLINNYSANNYTSTALVSLQSSYSSLQGQYSSLQSERSSLQVRNENLQTEKVNMKTLIEAGKAELNTKNAQIATVQNQLTTTQNQVREKDGVIQQKDIQINQKETQITQRDTRINQLSNELTTTRTTKDNQIGQLNTQVATKNLQITQITKEKDNANGQLTITRGQLEDLRTLFNNLQIANNDGVNALKAKDEELEKAKEKLAKQERKAKEKVEELKKMLGKSQSEVLKHQLEVKEEKLEEFTQSLKINRTQTRSLRDAYQQLIRVQENYNQEKIVEVDKNIEKIKDELLDNGISVANTRKLCHKCEKVARLRIEQIKLYQQQQFEAHQEVPTNH